MRIAIDIGHGPGTPNPRGAVSGGLVERDLVRQYAEAAVWHIKASGIGVTVFDRGPYADRCRGAVAAGCDGYFSLHLNAGGGDYALALVRTGQEVAAARSAIVPVQIEHGLDRAVIGANQERHGRWYGVGSSILSALPADVFGMVFEPFFIDTSHGENWTMRPDWAELTGKAVAHGIIAAMNEVTNAAS